MLLPPIGELSCGGGTGIGVDENRLAGVRVHGHRQLQVEVAPGAPRGPAVDALRKGGPLDPELRESGHLLLLGGEPRELGSLQHEIEGEEAPEDDTFGAEPSMADVLDAERPVQATPGDVAQPRFRPDAGDRMLGGNPLLDQPPHETMGGRSPSPDAEVVAVLGPRENTAMQTHEREPLRLGPGPAEHLQRRFTAAQVAARMMF